jgi:hypothetical protein
VRSRIETYLLRMYHSVASLRESNLVGFVACVQYHVIRLDSARFKL